MQSSSDVIKREGHDAQALKVSLKKCLMKVVSVSRERISIIDLNHYKIFVT